MSDLKDAALGAFSFAGFTTDKALDGFSEATKCETCESAPNHAAWTLGHLAYTYDSTLVEMAGQEAKLDGSWKTMYGMGSAPAVDDPHSFDELKAAFTERRQAMSDWFSGLSEEKAAEALPEEWAMFGKSVAGMMGALGAHENFHAGQLSVVRKKLGMDRVFG